MNRTSFIAACALMVLAFTLVARIVFGDAEKPAGQVAAGADSGAKPWVASNRHPEIPKSQANRARAIGSATSEGFTVRSGQHGKPTAGGQAASPDERAARVESHARTRLDELDRHLHLSAAQKRKVFPLLAKNAPGYDPSMVIDAASGRNPGAARQPTDLASSPALVDGRQPDISTAILGELNPDQQALYEDMLIDDGLWWAEIITKIDADFEQSKRNGVPPAAPTGDDTGAGENLFDLLGR